MCNDLYIMIIGYAWYLFTQATNKALHQSHMAIYNARLHILNSVFAKGRRWRSQINTVETRGSAGERLSRNIQAWCDGPSEEVTFWGHYIKGCGGTEGNDNSRTTIELMSS